MTAKPSLLSAARDKLRPYLPFAVKLCISGGLIYYLLRTQIGNSQDILAAMAQADPALLLLAFSLNTIGYLVCSWRWQILLRAQGFAVPLIELIRAYTIGIFFNSFLPGLMSGDFMRAMDISDRVPSYTRSFLILFVERLTGLFGLLILALLALPLIGREVAFQSGIGWTLIAATCVLAGLTAVFFSKVLRRVMLYLTGWPLLRRLSGIIRNISETSDAFASRIRVVYGCIGISVAFQANVVAHYFLIGQALGIEVPFYAYFAIIPVSLFVLMIPATVNGIGIREHIFIYLFGQFGVAPQLALSLAWIAFAMVLLQAVGGGIVFALRRKRPAAGPGGTMNPVAPLGAQDGALN
ncbi:lysylphosphatidylglycerol synthase transmembrane domain-containing protein [Poseidonocella sp. HB161398]|uniref:lysylphosphatidylglycerol synthase transmembrane domain-containing protein n=1 Tax=Poseidonocella sp. HB161398 TaxID=2320855 RepID=UPI0014868A30|nr:lysylphosphatidylglycerol synthase transmembrane domain-containing protein [Poseidonocella sp. HB161398]